MTITNEILTEFKERMRLEDHEDENLIRILTDSHDYFKKIFKDDDINENSQFKTLVFERSRYAYNDALEFFSDNFNSLTNDANIDKVLEEIVLEEGDPDATI